MKEVWKPIEGTDGRYEVSNTGKVRSLNYKNSRKVKNLKPAPDPKGYMKTMLCIGGVYKTVKLHRLVAEAFIPNPFSLPQVNHKDGKKDNNSVENLEWTSNYDNAHHALKHGLFENSIKAAREANEKRKKPVIAIDMDGNQTSYTSINEAGNLLKVNRRHIQEVLKGHKKRAGGYRFVYLSEGVMP